ncbi:hypothetical protein BCR33DRAFT_855434 [Rhizoclosmatium globosum]|uniref:WD40 repeat-like protein n=1 Tax=Rhizoclosmatium globosum TaxID=329046 RepID=A0A1Y2BPS5_9FUNG|nr:hypothetical protein BCR33DRAFT_855434 [Rhizoclosmatium globosum]|eukprot:ORY36175.1 hypothetical protein BCR33DRAFT_855434 [Rhizoclosmatium globosum]
MNWTPPTQSQYRETTISVRENHLLLVKHAAAIGSDADESSLLLATVGTGQANVYDCNYCNEGVIDLVSQLPLVCPTSNDPIQGTAVHWINTAFDLLLVVGDASGTVRVSSFTKTRELVRFSANQQDPITYLDSRTTKGDYPVDILVCSATSVASLWRVNGNMNVKKVLEVNAACACLLRDGCRIVYTNETDVNVLDVGEGIEPLEDKTPTIAFQSGHSGAIECICALSDDTVICRSANGYISILSLSLKSTLASFQTEKSPSPTFELNASKKLMCTVSKKPSSVSIYNVETGRLVQSLKVRQGMTIAYCFFAKGYLFSVGDNGLVVRLWIEIDEK